MAEPRRLPSGRWLIEVSVKRQRKSKTFRTKTEAKAWAREEQIRLESAGVTSNATLVQLFDRYADEVSETKKGARWEIIRLNKLKSYQIAEKRLVDLTREDFELWVDARLREVKPSSVNRELNLISHCLTQARRWRMMSHEPLKDLKRPKNPPHRDRRITQEEIETILHVLGYSDDSVIEKPSQRVAVAFLLAIETAMRAGEILSLTRANVDLSNRVAFLPETKNGAPRSVPLSSRAVSLLQRILSLNFDPIFSLSSASLSSIFRKAVISSAIPDLTFHDSRHEATTRLASKLHVLELARVTGHRDIKMLMTYYNESAASIARKLD